MATAKIPGSWERRGNSVRLTVDMGKDFRGMRDRRRKTVPYISDGQAAVDLLSFYNECQNSAVSYDGKITVSALCDKYLEVCAKRNIKKSTYSGYASIIRSSIKPLLGPNAAEKVTPLHIEEWINYLMEKGAPYVPKKNNHKEKKEKKGVSAKTISNRFALLSDIFETAVDWNMITVNPCAKVKLPKYRKPEAKSYTQQEFIDIITKLMELEDDQITLKTAIVLDLFSGLRKGELIGLKWENINLTTGECKIEATRMYTPEEGNYTDTPKSDSGFRTLVLPEFCVSMLKRLQLIYEAKRRWMGDEWGKEGDFVFLSDKGTPIGTSTIYKQYNRFLEENGFGKSKLHTLRHTNASMIHSINPNLSEISKWMGHSKISTTTDIYTHLFNDNSQKAIADKLQEKLVPILSPKEKTNA